MVSANVCGLDWSVRLPATMEDFPSGITSLSLRHNTYPPARHIGTSRLQGVASPLVNARPVHLRITTIRRLVVAPHMPSSVKWVLDPARFSSANCNDVLWSSVATRP